MGAGAAWGGNAIPTYVHATGTGQSGATRLTALNNIILSGTDVVASALLGSRVITNRTGNALTIWPDTNVAFENKAANSSEPLPNGNSVSVDMPSATQGYLR